MKEQEQDQLVSFRTAILAKEKGFNWGVRNYWYNNLPNDWYESDNDRPYNENEDPDHISRPTQSLLQKWLREEYHLNIRIATTSLRCHIPMLELLESGGTQMKPIYHSDAYKTYEEALEKGLQSALELLP